MKLLLTSTGLENPVIAECLLDMLRKPIGQVKALWIPTAAIDDEARAVLPKCMDDLLNLGIRPGNIQIYDLDYCLRTEQIECYDLVYVCGGNSDYLLYKMYQSSFVEILRQYVRTGGIYIGVSAGSCICAKNHENGIGLLPYKLQVHCEVGTQDGEVKLADNNTVFLTNRQAVLAQNNTFTIIS